MRFHWSGSVGKQELTITDDYGNANGKHYEGSQGYDLLGDPVPERQLPSLPQTSHNEEYRNDIRRSEIMSSADTWLEGEIRCTQEGV